MRPLALACLFLLVSSTSIADTDGTSTLSGWPSNESGLQWPSARQEPEFPPLAWPVENPLHDGLMITDYCDNDPAIPALLDYMCGDWTYDIIGGGNHEGTDFTLPSFRAMDRGVAILAAASGLVYMTEWRQFDRHEVAVEGLGNQLIVMQTDASGDTTGQFYNHLRRNSLTVEVGEVVVPGQMLGYIGSSGYSPYPHLHFSVGWSENGQIRFRDPFEGPCNTGSGGEPLPSLWIHQEPYVGNMPLRVYDLGVTTTSAIGAEPSWKERRTEPSIMGADEEYLVAWMLFQGDSGDSWRIEIRRPDNSLFADWEQAIPGRTGYSYAQRLTAFAGSVLPEDYGMWTVSALVASQVVMQVPFEVGEATVYAPRFYPVSGRSIRMDTPIVQRDTLRMSPLCEPVTFSFVDAPDFVAFEQDTIVTFTPPSSQPYRSLHFQVVATDAAARTDTFWYHIVDPTKPHAPSTDVPYAGLSGSTGLALSFPNPYLAHTAIGYSVDQPEHVTLQIYDMQGRLVETLLDKFVGAGRSGRVATWDGRDSFGRPAATGLYFYRLRAGHSTVTGKLVYVK